ncbi:MAG: Ig-like domain-containing protein [Gemmatimonadota bacterium]
MRRLSGLLVVLTLSGCGGGDGGTNPPPPATQVLGSIAATPTSINVAAGQSQSLTMVALDVNNAAIASASGYGFTSGTPSVAVVSSGGRVTGISAGSATITVSLTREGVTKTTTVATTVTGTLPLQTQVAAGNLTNDFTPAFVAIARTGTVTWSFGATIHNVEFGGASGAPGNIGNTSNSNVVRQFNNPGTFGYTCTLHAGMNGTVLIP